MLNISQVAKQTGLSAKTIRYYESIALIGPPPRGDNGYRYYNDSVLKELNFVKRARDAGFNLEQCKELVALYKDEGRSSAQVKTLTLDKITEIKDKISQLQLMLETLQQLADQCHGDEHPECPIIQEFDSKGGD